MSEGIDWRLYARLSDIVYHRGNGNEIVDISDRAKRVISKSDDVLESKKLYLII